MGKTVGWSALILGLLLFGAGGDAVQAASAGSKMPLAEADRAVLEKYLGKGVVGDPVASPALGKTEEYLPGNGTVQNYRVLQPGNAPSMEKHTVATADDPRFSPGWRLSYERGALYAQETSDSHLVTQAEEDLDNKVLSRFIPGEPLIIPGLLPGESQQATVRVEVADLSDQAHVSHKGKLSITYTYLGAFRVSVPAGSYDAALIRWSYKGSVGPASIKLTQYRFIAPKVGMVAMVESRHISAMLFYHDTTKLGKLLQSPDQ